MISERAERKLGPAERAGLHIHLVLCRACRNYRRSLRFLRALFLAASQSSVLSSSERLPPEAKERIRQRLAWRG